MSSLTPGALYFKSLPRCHATHLCDGDSRIDARGKVVHAVGRCSVDNACAGGKAHAFINAHIQCQYLKRQATTPGQRSALNAIKIAL